jgi:hypothetical protein
MDKNPKVTKALAATFMDNPVFENIAKNIKLLQAQCHYLPITLPTLYII